MSIVVVRRPERRPGPKPPRGEVLLESPPEIPEVQPQGFTAVLTYLPMLAGAAAMALMFTAFGNANPIMYVASGLFALSMVGMTVGQLSRQLGHVDPPFPPGPVHDVLLTLFCIHVDLPPFHLCIVVFTWFSHIKSTPGLPQEPLDRPIAVRCEIDVISGPTEADPVVVSRRELRLSPG